MLRITRISMLLPGSTRPRRQPQCHLACCLHGFRNQSCFIDHFQASFCPCGALRRPTDAISTSLVFCFHMCGFVRRIFTVVFRAVIAVVTDSYRPTAHGYESARQARTVCSLLYIEPKSSLAFVQLSSVALVAE